MRSIHNMEKLNRHHHSPGILEIMSKPKNTKKSAKQAMQRKPYAGTIAEHEKQERASDEESKSL